MASLRQDKLTMKKKQVRRTVMPYLHTQQKIVFEGREDTASAPEHIDGKNEWLP